MPAWVLCGACNGSGISSVGDPSRPCSACNGNGEFIPTVKGRFVTAEAWREHRRTMLVTLPQAEC